MREKYLVTHAYTIRYTNVTLFMQRKLNLLITGTIHLSPSKLEQTKTDMSMNLAFKHRTIFAVIKILNSSATIITETYTVITLHDQFPVGAAHAASFSIIEDE